MSLVQAPVPSLPAEVRSWTLDSLDDLADVRAELEASLPGGIPAAQPDPSDFSPSLIQRIVLVASELATNALRHGAPPVTLRLLQDGDAATIDVVDGSPDDPPVLADGHTPRAGGFGLLLAHRAAHQLGWFRTGDDQKHVWATFSGA